MRVHPKLAKRKIVEKTSHSNVELELELSCHSGWLSRHFQILQERKSNSSNTTQIKILQKQLQVLLSLSTSCTLFDSFLFHINLIFSFIFWATILKACLLELLKKTQNTVTMYFSTENIALPDNCAARGIVFHSLLWDEATPSNYKTNGMQLHFPLSASSHLGDLHFSCRWWNYLRNGGNVFILGDEGIEIIDS